MRNRLDISNGTIILFKKKRAIGLKYAITTYNTYTQQITSVSITKISC